MKPKWQVMESGGKPVFPPGMTKAREHIMWQLSSALGLYGIEKLDIGYIAHGATGIIQPKSKDMDVATRPKYLEDTKKTVMYHWANMMALFGIASVEMNPNEDDLKKISDMWDEMKRMDENGTN